MCDQCLLAGACVALAEIDTGLLRLLDQALAGPVHQLGVGREGDVLLGNRSVDDGAGEIDRLGCSGLHRHRQALLHQRRQTLLAHALAPAGHRRTVQRKPVAEKLLATEVLVIGVLKPASANLVVGKVVGVLENMQPRHQPRRQRRLTRTVRINRAQLLRQKLPVDPVRQNHLRVAHVENLIQAGAEHVLLARLLASPRLHGALRSTLGPVNHARNQNAICKKSTHLRPLSGNSEYLESFKNYIKSVRRKFFTVD